MKLGITKKDIEFAKSLQYEMLTQDNQGQAAPRYWAVQTVEEEVGNECVYDYRKVLDEDYEEITTPDGKAVKDMEGICKWINEKHGAGFECDGYSVEAGDEIFFDMETLLEYIAEEYGEKLQIAYCRCVHKIQENTMFLTQKACQKHIDENHYHYKKPHPYAMTAWRAPETERIIEIIEKINWDTLLELAEEE